ncbi:MAG: SLBB domain-containing protein [Candidatus Rifleibacteriota bacterium]
MNKGFCLRASTILLLMLLLNYWSIGYDAVVSNAALKRAVASSFSEQANKNGSFFTLDERPVYKMLFANKDQKVAVRQKQKGLNDISICVAGEVNFPGQFELPAGSTIIDGILTAGGLNQIGSLRKIKVLKDNNSCQKVDLYKFVYSEKTKDDRVILADGDTIVVPQAEILVKISGRVARAGVYELNNFERSLGWLLKKCGVKSLSEKSRKIDIYRYEEDFYKNIVSQKIDNKLFEDELSGFLLEDGDKVEILAETGNSPDIVELCGHFRYPGKIVLKTRTYLSEMVTRENLMYGHAKNYAEVLRRNDVKKEYEVLSFSLKALLAGDRSADLELKNGDRIMVFSQALFDNEAKVAIEGAVKKAGKYPWQEGLRVSDLIESAGGLNKEAGKTARIERRIVENGKLRQRTVIVNLEKALEQDSRYNIWLEPFDLLVCIAH